MAGAGDLLRRFYRHTRLTQTVGRLRPGDKMVNLKKVSVNYEKISAFDMLVDIANIFGVDSLQIALNEISLQHNQGEKMVFRKDVLTKMVELEIKDFSDNELDRVFGDCVGSTICKNAVKQMIVDGLTITTLYIEFLPRQENFYDAVAADTEMTDEQKEYWLSRRPTPRAGDNCH